MDEEFDDAYKNVLPTTSNSSLPALTRDLNLDQESPADDFPDVSDGDFCLTQSYPLDPENAAIESTDNFIEQPINTAQTVDDNPKNNANLGELTSLTSTNESIDNEQINKIIAQIVEKFFKDDNYDYNDDNSIEIEDSFFCCEIEIESTSIDDGNEEIITNIPTTTTANTTARKRGRPKKEDNRTNEERSKDLKTKNGESAKKYRKKQKLEEQETNKLEASLIETKERLKRTLLLLESQKSVILSKLPANWLSPATVSTSCSSSSDGDGCDAIAAAVAEHSYSKKLFF